jgi:D-tyrosyl-tRNA(Tyr) deacylase
MIGILQRVSESEVWVDGEMISRIREGILLLAGIARDDGPEDAEYVARKTAGLRIFADQEGNLNKSVLETGGSVLVVSQFTLLGDTRKGRRPSFSRAAPPERAVDLYRTLVGALEDQGVPVQEGRFRAMMDVKLVNSGPVTVIVDSKQKKQ